MLKGKKALAVIPARGGSKRLPRKNILPFLGKPMLIWTCEAARKANIFARIVVSTDDAEIANIVHSFGFEVFQRSPELATDVASCAQVCIEVLQAFEEQGEYYDILACLYATAPLRTAADICATMALLDDSCTNQSAFAICQYIQSPYAALSLKDENNYQPLSKEKALCKNQELRTPFIFNGSTAVIYVEALKENVSFYTQNIRGYTMPFMRSVDIDTQEEYELALCFAHHLTQEK